MDAMGISTQAAGRVSGGAQQDTVDNHMLANGIGQGDGAQPVELKQMAAEAGITASPRCLGCPPNVQHMVHFMHDATTACPAHVEVGQVAAAGVQPVHIQHRLRLVLVERALGGVQLAQVGANGTWGQGRGGVEWAGECRGQKNRPGAAARQEPQAGAEAKAGQAWRSGTAVARAACLAGGTVSSAHLRRAPGRGCR